MPGEKLWKFILGMIHVNQGLKNKMIFILKQVASGKKQFINSNQFQF